MDNLNQMLTTNESVEEALSLIQNTAQRHFGPHFSPRPYENPVLTHRLNDPTFAVILSYIALTSFRGRSAFIFATIILEIFSSPFVIEFDSVTIEKDGLTNTEVFSLVFTSISGETRRCFVRVSKNNPITIRVAFIDHKNDVISSIEQEFVSTVDHISFLVDTREMMMMAWRHS